jgi:hypothetical protein
VALAAPVLALASACGGGGDSAPKRTPAQVAADDAARDRALLAEQALIARYDAALRDPSVAADAALTARLTSIRAEHAAHLTAVGQGYERAAAVLTPSAGASAPPGSPTGSASAPTSASGVTPNGTPTTSAGKADPTPPTSPTPPASPAPTPEGSAPAAGSGGVVSTLVKAEQDASSRLTADIMDRDGATALLFASIAASEAGHAALLLGGAA